MSTASPAKDPHSVIRELVAPLRFRLAACIKRKGPMPWHEWMEAALYDEEAGYYTARERVRWGREGDYRTSPETSVLFGATFGRYFARLYKESKAPDKWTILEVGAGAGDFALAVFEICARRFPEMFVRLHYFVDERSTDARARIAERLRPYSERTHFDRLSEMQEIDSGVIFANELLDSFPAHRVTVERSRLRELYVDLNSEEEFCWTTGELSTPRLEDYFRSRSITLPEGVTADVNLDLESWLEQASKKLRSGYLILVDYGAETRELYNFPGRSEGTLRAFSCHRIANVLANPGQQDLTTTVDWDYVREVAQALEFQVVKFQRQDRFLRDAGILDELELRIAGASDEGEKALLRVGAREMALPGGMGEYFQVLVLRKV